MAFPLIMRMTAASVCISQKAGQIIRQVMNKGDLGIVSKGKNDVQTEADRSAQRAIMASLHKLFPKASLFGEEDLDPRDTANIDPDMVETNMDNDVLAHAAKFPENLKNVEEKDVVIWVDPVDGTSEYTEGLLDHVTVLIGICVHGKAVAGVIYQPYYNYQAGPDATLGRAIWGIIGLGAFGYDNVMPPADKRIITTTRSHSNKTVVESVAACDPTDVLRVGGAGHKVLLILEGKAHAYVFGSPGCKKWDTAAPEAILHAAGGKLTDVHGNTLPYHHNCQRRNTSGVLAVPREEMHQWYLERMPQSVKDALPFQADQ